MNIREYFRKGGGSSLIKSYIANRVIFFAIIMFAILPKNRKGFELLRENVNLKIYSRLQKKYKKIIKEYKPQKKILCQTKTVWFCWFQGLENAPILVRKCYESIRQKCEGYRIQVITENNFNEFTDIPDYIIQKWQNGIISNTHFSDIIRTNLLYENGGIWIDSTVFMTDTIPNEIEDADFFLFQTLKPGKDGKSTNISSWFLKCCKFHPIIELTQQLLFSYWKKNNQLCDYFLFHQFMQMSLEEFPEYFEKIPAYTNEYPHLLLFKLKDTYNSKEFDYICHKSFLHKLTNKFDYKSLEGKKTFYNYVIGEL